MGSLPEQVDLVVIGGGFGGYSAAIRGAQLGLSVALIEKEKLGGHCLNYACIPSKTMLHIADIFYAAKHSEMFGIKTDSISVDPKKMLQWRMDVSKKLEAGVEFLCKSNQVELVKGIGTFLSSNTLQSSNGVIFEFKKAIIATGSEPTVLKGFEFAGNIIDYKQALLQDKIPKTLLIIGGGYVSVEIATLYSKLGSKVTIINKSELLSSFDKDATALIKKRLLELGVEIKDGLVPVSKEKEGIKFNDGSNLTADLILVAIGLSPFVSGLGLNNTKVEMDSKGFIKVDNRLMTNDPNIFAVGDVSGGPLLAHKALRQGIVAAEVAAGLPSSYDNLAVPAVIFSDPEVAIVGDIEEKAGIKITKFPLTASGIGIALAETNGFVKMSIDEKNVIKGVEVVAPDAHDIIAEAALAIEMGATAEDIAATIHPHPTFSEILKDVSEGALGKSTHFFYGKK